MQVSERSNKALHSKLPIDAEENILAVYRHHWFAYASSWIVGIFIVIVLLGLTIALMSLGGNTTLAANKVPIFAGVGVFCVLVLVGTSIPVYLRSQEQLVLTDEALLQVLQPSLFSSKIDQLALQRIDDIAVRQDFFGTILGYGHLTIETPGEQDNYEFYKIPHAHEAAREISSAKENFEAALQAGRVPTTYAAASQPAAPQQQPIDPAQYQQFLEYQRMVAAQQASQNASAATPQPLAVPTQSPAEAPIQGDQPPVPNQDGEPTNPAA